MSIIHPVKVNKVVVTGSIAYDDIMVFPGAFKDYFHPERLHQINVSFVVDDLSKHIGGTATNISYAIRLFTDKPVIMLGAVGRDHAQISAFFKKHRIASEHIIIDNALYTATGKVITDVSDNQIWGYYYGASIRGAEIDFSLHAADAFFIISANHPHAFLHAQRYCVEHKVPYLYDPGMTLTWITDHDLAEGIAHATYLVGNDYEIAMIGKRLKTSVAKIKAQGTSVITTLGADGVRYEDKQEQIEIPGIAVATVVDPTGAGDAWRGGFVGALCEGRSIREALRAGNALASIAVEHSGTVEYAPSPDEIQARIHKLGKVN